MIKNKFAIIVFLAMSLLGTNYAQSNKLSVGSYLGIGEIKSNSPSFTSFAGSVFIEYSPPFAGDFSFRLNFIYARKMEYFLNENRTNKEYPFIKAFNLKIYAIHKLTETIYAEEGIGPLVLNDRTFSDVNVWNYGVAFSALIGLDFCDKFKTGFTLGVGFDYGTTFSNTAANYYLTYIQLHYYF